MKLGHPAAKQLIKQSKGNMFSGGLESEVMIKYFTEEKCKLCLDAFVC